DEDLNLAPLTRLGNLRVCCMKASGLDIIILEQNKDLTTLDRLVLFLPRVAASWTAEVSPVAAISHHLFLDHGDFFVATPGTYNFCHSKCLQIDLQHVPYLVCSGVSINLSVFGRI
ncbi:MAG: hypothetical protein ACW974_10795, partial [Candidatus Thorarchaeota archaeon]